MIKLTAEQKQAIYDLREEGLSCSKIANKLGFSESLVDYYLRKLTKAERNLQIVDNETLYSEIDFLKDQLNRQKKLNAEWKKKCYAIKRKDKGSFYAELTKANKAVAMFEKQVNILWLCINRAIDDIDHNNFDVSKFYEQARLCRLSKLCSLSKRSRLCRPCRLSGLCRLLAEKLVKYSF